jgi:hypothetical protein
LAKYSCVASFNSERVQCEPDSFNIANRCLNSLNLMRRQRAIPDEFRDAAWRDIGERR